MFKYVRIAVLSQLMLWATLVAAQDKVEISDSDYTNNEVEMADTMRSNGKIYVVVAVIVSIFAGLVVYTVVIDRKISRLEKQSD